MHGGIKAVFAPKKVDGTIATINNEILGIFEKFYNCRYKCENQKEIKLS